MARHSKALGVIREGDSAAALVPGHCRRVLVLHEGKNPSTDFYIRSRLAHTGLKIEYCTSSRQPDAAALEKAWVIIVRYCSPDWQRLLQVHRHKLCGLSYFMDDDLFDLRVLPRVSGGLGWKWFWLGWRYQFWLRRMGAHLWVSTPYLAVKYSDWRPRVLPPCNPYDDIADVVDLSRAGTVFYHGGLSHRGEQRWLKPVFAELLRRCPSLHIEVMGGRAVRRLFAGMDRICVLPPTDWGGYRRCLQRPGRVVGLAPLLPGPVNAARAPTRFFDITAAGAVGVYADSPVYASLVEHGQNGLLLPMAPELWVEQILTLLDQPKWRQMLHSGAVQTIFKD